MPRPEFPSELRGKAVEIVPKQGSYLAQIYSVLTTFGKSQLIPPKAPEKNANMATLLGEAYLWDEVQSFAKKQSDKLWAEMEKQEVIPDKSTLDQGPHVLAESRRFVVSATVSAPVKRFSPDELAKLMKKEYKVPEPRTKELCEAAKKGTTGQVRLAISER